jgi:NDP-sugar pyrophosphorylase family protein
MSPKKPRRIRRAILPVAGLVTRMLPATKVLPKEPLPLTANPRLQYAAEECLGSGIDEVILVTDREKRLIEDCFKPAPRLESMPGGLASCGFKMTPLSPRRHSQKGNQKDNLASLLRTLIC